VTTHDLFVSGLFPKPPDLREADLSEEVRQVKQRATPTTLRSPPCNPQAQTSASTRPPSASTEDRTLRLILSTGIPPWLPYPEDQGESSGGRHPIVSG
jgi:hypothetical protein